jgi:hypothetical protein
MALVSRSLCSPGVRAWWIATVLLSGCGGKIAPLEGADGAPDTTELTPSTDAAPASPPISSVDATTAADTTPVVDSTPPLEVSLPDGPAGIDCSAMKASGSPADFKCSSEIACADGPPPYPGFVADMLSCLVDECEAELGHGKWCGTIMLGLDAMGCYGFDDVYSESPSAAGCVKYQGLYRRWLCAKGTKVVVTRPCGG